MQKTHNVMPALGGPANPVQRRRLALAQAGLLAVSAALPGLARAAQPVLRVAAASDLKFVLTELLRLFGQESGVRVEATFGSSGNFARQIRQGLPVHLFMSADESWVLQLAQAGLTRVLPGGARDTGAIYGLGRIALLVPEGSGIGLDPELRGLRAAWASVTKFAIAHPEHAPYGRAAREALAQLGLWELASQKLVLGENIAQATQFVSTGAAQAGITALALAVAPEIARQTRHVVLPASLHQPLRQCMVLLDNAPPEAVRLYDFLRTPRGAEVFRRYGFAP